VGFLDVTDTTFPGAVLDSEVPVIAHFTAPGCRPCKAIEPHLVAIADDYGDRVRLVRVDIDANLDTPGRYGVLSIPTVILFAAGEPRETLVGAHPRTRYEDAFASHLGRHDAGH
jgi:thioredoxin 1